MLDYLANYGMKRPTVEFVEIDITDKINLGRQINALRLQEFDLLKLLDQIGSRQLDVASSMRTRAMSVLRGSTLSRNAALSADEEYAELESELDALKSASSMVSNMLQTVRSDIGILRSTLYNKF